VIARGEALIIHRDAVVERLGIGDHRPCVFGCVQELPHEVVLPNPFGTGHIEGAVERLSEGHIGHDRGDVSRRNGLHQNRWKPNRLPFRRELGDAAHELEELRGTHDRVRNRGSLDQFFLGHLRPEVTTREHRQVHGASRIASSGWLAALRHVPKLEAGVGPVRRQPGPIQLALVVDAIGSE
jgi:hypothetical protein